MRDQEINSLLKRKNQLIVLIDPDKPWSKETIFNLKKQGVSAILVGGSILKKNNIKSTVAFIKKHSTLPVIIFPGDGNQIASNADGIMLLSMIASDNPKYISHILIDHIYKIKKSTLKTVSTAYILIDTGTATSVTKATGYKGIPVQQKKKILDTCIAAELMGFACIYLEAGSGANKSISINLIRNITNNINIPLILGGGINTLQKLDNYKNENICAVVVGTAIERNQKFLSDRNY